MIRLGFDDAEKKSVVDEYVRAHGIQKVFVISPEQLAPSFAAQRVTTPEQLDGSPGWFLHWPEHIQYRFYYRILQQVDADTLLVVNECLRGQQRTMLNFNCIRTFLKNVKHKVILQRFPIVESIEDFMVLLDFETGSRWWDRSFDRAMLADVDFAIRPRTVEFKPIHVSVDAKTHATYQRERAKLFAEVKADIDLDPHQIPRNLLLASGRGKLPFVQPGVSYVGRNNRFKLPNLVAYRDLKQSDPRVVFELPHNFLEMTDFLTVSQQDRVSVLVADTKAEGWYWDRFQSWSRKVNDAAELLHG